MSGSQELLKLSEFRSRVESFYPECDQKLLTWLRARELNVDKAEQMLRRNLIWRKNNEVNTLVNWQPAKIFFPFIHTGFDFENHPVFILPIGRWDLRGMIEAGDMVAGLKCIYQSLEIINLMAIRSQTYQAVLVCDFDGFEYRQIAHRTVMQGMIEILRVFESNYPEILRFGIVINAPMVFHVMFKLVKPLLNSRTQAKIHIYGPDRQKWQSHLLQNVMSKDQLPPYWGGSLVGKDEYCSDLWFGEPLSPYFMRKISTTNDEFGEEWFTVKVEPREQFKLNYLVEDDEQQCTTLKWSFTTDSYDIGFSIGYAEGDADAEGKENNSFIVPYQRVDSHVKRTDGSLKLERSGKYTLIFDNSYSRSRAKILHCSVSLVKDNLDEMFDKASMSEDQVELLFKDAVDKNCNIY